MNPPPELPDVTLCFNRAMRLSANRLRSLYDSALAPCGLRAHEFGLLSAIQAAGSIGIVELADAFLFDRATLRYKLGPLERAGLVEYVIDARDRRSRRLCATAAGLAKLAEARGPWTAMQGRVEETLGPGEAAALRITATRLVTSPFPEPPSQTDGAAQSNGRMT